MWHAHANESTRQQKPHYYSLGRQSGEILEDVFPQVPGSDAIIGRDTLMTMCIASYSRNYSADSFIRSSTGTMVSSSIPQLWNNDHGSCETFREEDRDLPPLRGTDGHAFRSDDCMCTCAHSGGSKSCALSAVNRKECHPCVSLACSPPVRSVCCWEPARLLQCFPREP